MAENSHRRTLKKDPESHLETRISQTLHTTPFNMLKTTNNNKTAHWKPLTQLLCYYKHMQNGFKKRLSGLHEPLVDYVIRMPWYNYVSS